MEKKIRKEEDDDGRRSKQFGDFAENLVMYMLGRYKKMKVALVDHEGADIIATKIDSNDVYAISVKGRHIIDESFQQLFKKSDADKLKKFAKSFGMIPAIAFVFVDNADGIMKIRMFVFKLETLEKLALDTEMNLVSLSHSKSSTNDGYWFKYYYNKKKENFEKIKNRDDIEYMELEFEKPKEFFEI